ncbi:MAG TPA: hypothetical protein PKJ62_05705 [Bacteroidia bacterium]|nr:hypothetical protein [Bacteroidia bacterium]
MKAKKHIRELLIPDHKPVPRFKNVIVIDENETENKITEAIMRACYVASDIKLETNPHAVIHKLHNIERLSEVPELIFINLSMKALKDLDFIEEFENMSDFVKNKCKLIVLSNDTDAGLKHKVMLSPSVVRYLVKPLDAFQLREFIS